MPSLMDRKKHPKLCADTLRSNWIYFITKNQWHSLHEFDSVLQSVSLQSISSLLDNCNHNPRGSNPSLWVMTSCFGRAYAHFSTLLLQREQVYASNHAFAWWAWVQLICRTSEQNRWRALSSSHSGSKCQHAPPASRFICLGWAGGRSGWYQREDASYQLVQWLCCIVIAWMVLITEPG